MTGYGGGQVNRRFMVVMVLFIATTGYAGELWNLEDCLALARAHSPGVERAEADISSAKGSLYSSWSGILPGISGYADATRYSSEQISFYQDEARISRNRYSWGLRLNQTIFNGGSSWARLSAGKASVRAAEERYRATWGEIALQVAEGYYGVLRAAALVTVSGEAEELARRQLERAEERYRMGAASRQEVLKGKVTLYQDKLTRMQRENELEAAKSLLLRLMGQEPGTEFELVEPEGAGAEVPELEACVEMGEEHPSVRAYEAQLSRAKRNVTMARAGWFPSLTGSASYGWSDIEIPEDADQYKDRDSWSLGLTVGLNIFDGLETAGSVQQAKASERSAAVTLREQRLSHRHAVEDSHRELKEALAQQEVAEVSMELAEEEYRLAEEQYGMGSLSFLELSDSKLALEEAKVTLIDSRYSVFIARASLNEATGRLGR